DQELEQVIDATGFRPTARHLESTEGMAADDGTRAGTIDINITCNQFRFDALDVRGTAGEKSGGECVVGIVRNQNGFIKIDDSNDAQDRSENFFAGEPHRRAHVSEN